MLSTLRARELRIGPFLPAGAPALTHSGAEVAAWHAAAVTDTTSGETHGTVSVGPAGHGRSAEIAFTSAAAEPPSAPIVEAITAVVGQLFADERFLRAGSAVTGDDAGAAMVLEASGLVYEGNRRSSRLVGENWADEWSYGMTRDDWAGWSSRPRNEPRVVRLVEINTGNEREVSKLETHHTQRAFVAPMGWSFTDALYPEVVDGAPVLPWLRAVEADGVIVGFVMLALRTDHHPEPYLWRLLVDRRHQRRGIGGRVLDALAHVCRGSGDTALTTSWDEGIGSPRPFYEAKGFVATGRIIDGETEARWRL